MTLWEIFQNLNMTKVMLYTVTINKERIDSPKIRKTGTEAKA